MRKFQTILIGLLLSISLSLNAAEAGAVAIIASKTSKIQKIDAGELSLIFLRKKLYWGDGKRIIPINLPSNHIVRKLFSVSILGGLPETQAEYWNEAYYLGISPPHVITSEDGAIRFVEITPGAIAYIDACKATEAVKTVAWISSEGNLLQQAPNLNCAE
jgi:ABC-type phosphate transport system substrate-binding protein